MVILEKVVDKMVEKDMEIIEAIAKENLQILTDGYYFTKSGKKVVIEKKGDSEFWSEERLKTDLGKEKIKAKNDTKVYCTAESVVDFVFRMQKEGVDLNSVVVLHFASPINPCGCLEEGYCHGQGGEIVYCSNLYSTMEIAPFQEANRYGKDFYSHSMVVSRVTFFRDSAMELVEHPATVTVVSCAAVCLSMYLGLDYGYAKGIEVMRERMFYILCLFEKLRSKVISLGAFGCGYVDKHSPHTIALYWDCLLSFIGGAFDEVVMPVPKCDKEENQQAFMYMFGKRGKH